jgi:hypothetical protein
VAEVPPESPVAQACANIGVSGDEEAVEPLVVMDGTGLAQGVQLRVRIGDEGRIGRVEADGGGGDLRTLDAGSRQSSRIATLGA